MAKFIIEVSDGYILERANIENILTVPAKDKVDTMKSMMDILFFGKLKKDIEEGKTEFYLSSKAIEDDKERNLFNSLMSEVAAICIIQQLSKVNKVVEDIQAFEGTIN